MGVNTSVGPETAKHLWPHLVLECGTARSPHTAEQRWPRFDRTDLVITDNVQWCTIKEAQPHHSYIIGGANKMTNEMTNMKTASNSLVPGNISHTQCHNSHPRIS